jgi:hypothetical protein
MVHLVLIYYDAGQQNIKFHYYLLIRCAMGPVLSYSYPACNVTPKIYFSPCPASISMIAAAVHSGL